MFLILGVLSAPRREFDQRPRAFFCLLDFISLMSLIAAIVEDQPAAF